MLLHRRGVLYGMATLPAAALPAATVPPAAVPPAAVPPAVLPSGVLPVPAGKVHDCRGLRAALRDAGPGDVVELAPGDYLDDDPERLVLTASDVVLRAAGLARPVLRVPLVVRGDAVRIQGLAFADPPEAAAAPSHGLDGDELAMVEEFALEEGLSAAALRRVLGPTKLRIAGTRVEVADAEFFGTRGVAITITGQARDPHIHDCYFHDPRGAEGGVNAANGAIQVGQGMADTNRRISALVERNRFERWAFAAQTISVKSSGNTVRDNLFVASRNVTNRHGEGNTYEGNTLERSGGITVHDRGTRVLRNRLSGGGSIRVMGGDIPCDVVRQGGHPQACDTFLEGNTGLLVVGVRFPGDNLPALDTVVASHQGRIELRPGGQVRTRLPGGRPPGA